MHKQKGFTIIELLVAVAIGIVIVGALTIALYSARKESRDVKRLSDIQQLRSSMAAIKVQFGSYLDAGCPIGDVRQCQDTNLDQVMPTIKKFKDPKGTVLCTEDCTQSCQYAFSNERDDQTYTVLFYLEKGIDQFNKKGCYTLTEQGVSFLK